MQSNIVIRKARRKDYYLCFAFLTLVCISGFGLIYYTLVLYDISLVKFIKIASSLPDILFMNADSGSGAGDVVPDLSSDTSDVSDVDHEKGKRHQLLQEKLRQRAEEHQRQLEEQARLEVLNQQLVDRVRELENKARLLEEQSRRAKVFAKQLPELASEYVADSRQADEQARLVNIEIRELRLSINQISDHLR